MMKVHRAIAQALVDLGTDPLFGLVGDANMYLVDSYVRDCKGRYVATAQESGAILMALGHAQVSQRVGVATVTQGPGLTNALTALVEGVKCASPLVLLAGDTPTEDRDHFQNVHQREFVRATGAGFEQLRAPGTVAQDLTRAFRRALVERRPIVLNMPSEFQWLDADYERPVLKIPETRSAISTSGDMDEAIGMIASSRRPAVIAGRGAMHAEAAILRFAERIQAPVATSLRGRGLFGNDPFNLGVCGTISSSMAAETLMHADCLIAFGASLNRYTTGLGGLVRNKRIIQVNPLASELGKLLDVNVGLVGDPGLTADAMVRWLDEAEIPGSGWRSEHLRERIGAFQPPARMIGRRKPGTVDMIEAMRALNGALPANRVCVTDGGRFKYCAWSHIEVTHPTNFIYALAYGAVGLGLGEAIGAAVAAKGRPTLLLLGDGGLMLSGFSELHTAVRERLDLVVVVCNDGSYGAEHVHLRNRNMDPAIALFDWPDFAPIAQAMGAQSATVSDEGTLAQAMAALKSRDSTRPFLIDLKLDPDCMPP